MLGVRRAPAPERRMKPWRYWWSRLRRKKSNARYSHLLRADMLEAVLASEREREYTMGMDIYKGDKMSQTDDDLKRKSPRPGWNGPDEGTVLELAGETPARGPASQRAVDELMTRAAIRTECKALCDMLLEKNEKYGNSALDPVRVFSAAGAEEQLLVRIDDKLSRLKRGRGPEDEDVVRDLAGYLVLLLCARRAKVSPVS